MEDNAVYDGIVGFPEMGFKCANKKWKENNKSAITKWERRSSKWSTALVAKVMQNWRR